MVDGEKENLMNELNKINDREILEDNGCIVIENMASRTERNNSRSMAMISGVAKPHFSWRANDKDRFTHFRRLKRKSMKVQGHALDDDKLDSEPVIEIAQAGKVKSKALDSINSRNFDNLVQDQTIEGTEPEDNSVMQ